MTMFSGFRRRQDVRSIVPSRNLLEAFWLKLRFNLKAEAANTYLSYLWWLLEPVLLVLVFYLVFKIMLDRGGDDFLLFLLLGKIPFLWFSKSVNNAANSILAGKGLINQLAIPKPFFPLLVVAQDTVKQLVVVIALVCFTWGWGIQPSISWMVLPLVVLVQLMLIASIALLVAAITPYLPDFKYIINTGMIMLMLGSGIFYDYRQALEPDMQRWFLMNPMAQVIEGYREVLLRDSLPSFVGLGSVAAGSLLLLGLMFAYYARRDASYARLVIQ